MVSVHGCIIFRLTEGKTGQRGTVAETVNGLKGEKMGKYL